MSGLNLREPIANLGFPLEIVGVFDAGNANLERIVIRVVRTADLSYFGLLISLLADDGSSLPLRDNMLWFGTAAVNAGDWIFVYTAPGEFRKDDIHGSDEKIYSIHWGKTETIFQARNLTPSLFHMDVFLSAVRNDIPKPQHAVQRTGDENSAFRFLG